jgi:hypothetical protein
MKVFGFHMMIKAFVSQFNIEIKSSFFPSLLRLQRKMVGRGGAVRCGAGAVAVRCSRGVRDTGGAVLCDRAARPTQEREEKGVGGGPRWAGRLG